MKGTTVKIVKTGASKPVKFIASLCLIPKAIAELPKAAVEVVKVFADDVKDEMADRTHLVNTINLKER